MSYRTRFTGQFNLDKPLTLEQFNILNDFAERDHRHDELSDMPGFHCEWIPTKDGKALVYSDNEVSFYGYDKWLTYLIEHFLAPWGYTVNGSMRWQGEETGDTGTLTCTNNVVTMQKDEDLLTFGRVYSLFLSLRNENEWQLQLNQNGSGQLCHMQTKATPFNWSTLEEAERVLHGIIGDQFYE